MSVMRASTFQNSELVIPIHHFNQVTMTWITGRVIKSSLICHNLTAKIWDSKRYYKFSNWKWCLGTQPEKPVKCIFVTFITCLKVNSFFVFHHPPHAPRVFNSERQASCSGLERLVLQSRLCTQLLWNRSAGSSAPAPQPAGGRRAGRAWGRRLDCSRLVSYDTLKMAEGESCTASAAEIQEDFEIVDKKQIPNTTELKNEEKEKTEEARWSAPILSLAKKASENLALSYGNALKSASLVGFISKPVSNDSTAKTSMVMFI